MYISIHVYSQNPNERQLHLVYASREKGEVIIEQASKRASFMIWNGYVVITKSSWLFKILYCKGNAKWPWRSTLQLCLLYVINPRTCVVGSPHSRQIHATLRILALPCCPLEGKFGAFYGNAVHLQQVIWWDREVSRGENADKVQRNMCAPWKYK